MKRFSRRLSLMAVTASIVSVLAAPAAPAYATHYCDYGSELGGQTVRVGDVETQIPAIWYNWDYDYSIGSVPMPVLYQEGGGIALIIENGRNETEIEYMVCVGPSDSTRTYSGTIPVTQGNGSETCLFYMGPAYYEPGQCLIAILD